jgi:hypothetical protein
MRTAFLALSLFIATAVAGCGVEPPPSTEASQLDDLAASDPAALACPTICGLETQCQLPDGSCQEVCNPCFCNVRHGTVVKSCPAAAAPAEPPVEDLVIIGGGACGPTTCGPGTHCCNASCGVCVRPGGVCTQQICNPTN